MSSSQSRHVYTREERAILEASFARQSHPDLQEKERLAKLFNCNLIQISNWFQNHRRRVKKQVRSKQQSSTPKMEPQTHNIHNPYYIDYQYQPYHNNSCYCCCTPASMYPCAIMNYPQATTFEPNTSPNHFWSHYEHC